MSKTVLITGASSGFGKDAISVFHQRGWNIIATMRTPEKGTELTKMDRILVTRLDVTDKQSIRDAVDKSIERFGTIDVLVNNAGYGAIGALEAASDDTIRQQFDVNFFGLIDVTITIPFGSLYHATKFALEGRAGQL